MGGESCVKPGCGGVTAPHAVPLKWGPPGGGKLKLMKLRCLWTSVFTGVVQWFLQTMDGVSVAHRPGHVAHLVSFVIK